MTCLTGRSRALLYARPVDGGTEITHVFCGKPLARDADEALEIRRVVEAAGVVRTCAADRRFVPAEAIARSAVGDKRERVAYG